MPAPDGRPLKTRVSRYAAVASLLALVAAAELSGLQQPSKTPLPPDADPAEEAFIQTPAGFSKPGKPALAPTSESGTVRLTILDQATGRPTFARVNVVGADGNYYEPDGHALARWSLSRAGNRPGKGPIRYYGWFFYSSGEAAVRVPAGSVRIEVWKGYEFRPEQVTTHIAAGASHAVTVTLRRSLPMADHDYYSGDTHIHLDRRNPDDDERALDLLAAEDIGTGYLLCMNETNAYAGSMRAQLIPQERGFGPDSVRSRGPYTIVSGQEYRASTYGHICLLMHRRLVLEGETVDPRNWPVFGLVGRETRQLGGVSFHAHGGYSQEIYADFAQRATDGVELLQFAEYRGIGLAGWYRMWNIGYRFPAVGACDYPYCRALGDSRTYVHAAARPDPAAWARLAAEGRSFFTTGPMLLLEVDGQGPGASLRKAGKGPHRVSVRVRACCEVAPLTHLEIIVNGRAIRQLAVPRSAGSGQWLVLEEPLSVTESSWIAARAWSKGPTPKADAEAHTNPVTVYVDGKAPYRREDVDWLIERVGDQIAEAEKRTFDEKPRVLEFFQNSRAELLRVRESEGQAAPDGSN